MPLFGLVAVGSVFGVRAAEGWVERSTSSGSAWEGEEAATRGGSFKCSCQLVVLFMYGIRRKRTDQEGVLGQRRW